SNRVHRNEVKVCSDRTIHPTTPCLEGSTPEDRIPHNNYTTKVTQVMVHASQDTHTSDQSSIDLYREMGLRGR
ncbi:MAG: hypothetical protein ACI4B5_06875, partial [Bacteroidaceae bacterium]